jgi:hypothetical protein
MNIIKNKRIFNKDVSIDIESDGAGISLVTNDDKIKSLIAGTNIVITDNGTTVTIASDAQDEILIVTNYSALPDPTTVSGQFYWVSNSEGTQWLPGSWGGTYYNKGLYYSNGVSWEYIETPYQATQAEVNTGTNDDKFVTPSTLRNSTQFQYLDATSSIQGQLDNKSSIVGSYRRIAHDYTPVSGTLVTTEEVLRVISVSASIVSSGDMLEVYSPISNTSNVNTKTWRMYINTTPDLAGSPVKLATAQVTTNTQSTIFSKKIPVISLTSVFCYGGPTTSGLSPYGSIQAASTIETVPDLSNQFYIIITSQKSVNTDGMGISYSELYITKN